jgi:hypothetical protein
MRMMMKVRVLVEVVAGVVIEKMVICLTYDNTVTRVRCQWQVRQVCSGDAWVTRHKVEGVHDVILHAAMQSVRRQTGVSMKNKRQNPYIFYEGCRGNATFCADERRRSPSQPLPTRDAPEIT